MSSTTTAAVAPQKSSAGDLFQRFTAVRAFTDELCRTLSPEDCCLQSMTNASPTRWHLAHTSWFFETFLLKTDRAYQPFDEHYEVLFNSYYNSVGEQFPRDRRGLLSRPSLAQVQEYRRHVDGQVAAWFASGRIDADANFATVIEWGLHHEQQHQELILTDVKHLFSLNPLLPAFRGVREGDSTSRGDDSDLLWLKFDEGVYAVGHDGDGFAYDNEGPPHRVFVDRFQLASRPVTSGEFLEFVKDRGYQRPELWLSEGWSRVNAEPWARPIYWRQREGAWFEFTLAGLRPLDLAAPLSHVSYFEADAFARWAGARLPTEFEWEIASAKSPLAGHFVDTLLADDHAIHPRAERTATEGGLRQMFGDVWEWMSSSYAPYPGYSPPSGALGEYNGKFMCNQYVLRGGSCATPSTHIRRTYRNFFATDARWQFSGLRLAK